MTQSSSNHTLIDRSIGALYAGLYYTERKHIFGITIAGLLKNLPWLFALFAWPFGLGLGWIIFGILLALVIRVLYWRAKRAGYIRFVSEEQQEALPDGHIIANDHKVPLLASGTFSVRSREAYVRQHPAQYWRVGMGDHAIMINYKSGRFLYQFIQPAGLEKVVAGNMCSGRKPHPALEITYISNWGPESTEISFNFFERQKEDNPAKMRRQIYLAFDTLEQRAIVWKSLIQGIDHLHIKES